MSERPTRLFTLPALAASLALNVVFVSCAAEVVAPTPPQSQDPAVLAQLTSIMQRLDSIDARTARIDENTGNAVQAIVDQISDQLGDPEGPLVAALAGDLGVSMELCVNLENSLGMEGSFGVTGEGGGKGQIGPNVVEADAMARAELKLEGDIKAAAATTGSVAVAICGGAGVGLETSVDLDVVLDAARSAAASVGLDGSQLQTLANAVSTPTGADYQSVVSNVSAALPIPSSIQSQIDNPMSLLSSSPGIMAFGIDNRCNPALFAGAAALTDMQTRLCNLQIPSAEAYIGILNGLTGLPGQLTTLSSGLASACGALDAIVPTRVSIPSRSITIGPILTWGPQTFTTFPGFSTSLFSNIPVDC